MRLQDDIYNTTYLLIILFIEDVFTFNMIIIIGNVIFMMS